MLVLGPPGRACSHWRLFYRSASQSSSRTRNTADRRAFSQSYFHVRASRSPSGSWQTCPCPFCCAHARCRGHASARAGLCLTVNSGHSVRFTHFTFVPAVILIQDHSGPAARRPTNQSRAHVVFWLGLYCNSSSSSLDKTYTRVLVKICYGRLPWRRLLSVKVVGDDDLSCFSFSFTWTKLSLTRRQWNPVIFLATVEKSWTSDPFPVSF